MFGFFLGRGVFLTGLLVVCSNDNCGRECLLLFGLVHQICSFLKNTDLVFPENFFDSVLDEFVKKM